MKTLNLKEAAAFLKMTPEGLRRKIIKKEVPASKIGKCWLFIETDLVEHIRSSYSKAAKTSWGVVEINRRTTWHSTKEIMSGGFPLAGKEREYKKALGLPTK